MKVTRRLREGASPLGVYGASLASRSTMIDEAIEPFLCRPIPHDRSARSQAELFGRPSLVSLHRFDADIQAPGNFFIADSCAVNRRTSVSRGLRSAATAADIVSRP